MSIPEPINPALAAALGGQTTALVAKGSRVALAHPPEYKGIPSLAIQFQLVDDRIITIMLPEFFGMGAVLTQMEEDAKTEMQAMLDAIDAEAEAAEPAPEPRCRCGKRIFGGAAKRGHCLACGPDDDAAVQ